MSNKAVKIKNNLLKIGNREIKYFSKENIDEIDLNNIDVLIDCTGKNWSTKSIKNLKKKLKHLIFTIFQKTNFKYF